jgi:hypothetical protein
MNSIALLNVEQVFCLLLSHSTNHLSAILLSFEAKHFIGFSSKTSITFWHSKRFLKLLF